MIANLEKIGNPGFEAVSLSDAKEHAQVQQTADDALITGYTTAARKLVERDLNTALVSQQYKLYLDSWTHNTYYNTAFYPGDDYYRHNFKEFYPLIAFPIQPVLSVDSITYTDPDGNPQTLDSSQWELRAHKDPPHIKLSGTLPGIESFSEIVVNFHAGFSAANAIEPDVIVAIKFLVTNWYEYRVPISQYSMPIPLGYERIIQKAKVRSFF